MSLRQRIIEHSNRLTAPWTFAVGPAPAVRVTLVTVAALAMLSGPLSPAVTRAQAGQENRLEGRVTGRKGTTVLVSFEANATSKPQTGDTVEVTMAVAGTQRTALARGEVVSVQDNVAEVRMESGEPAFGARAVFLLVPGRRPQTTPDSQTTLPPPVQETRPIPSPDRSAGAAVERTATTTVRQPVSQPASGPQRQVVDRRPVFGVVGGMNQADFRTEGVSETIGRRSGIMGGIAISQPISPGVSIVTEVVYSQKGAAFPDVDGVARIDWLQMPVMAQVRLADATAFSPFVLVGPSVAYRIVCEIEEFEDAQQCEDAGYSVKSLDYGLVVGAGVTMRTMSVSLRYDYGLANISDAGSPEGTPERVFNRALTVAVGLSFPPP